MLSAQRVGRSRRSVGGRPPFWDSRPPDDILLIEIRLLARPDQIIFFLFKNFVDRSEFDVKVQIMDTKTKTKTKTSSFFRSLSVSFLLFYCRFKAWLSLTICLFWFPLFCLLLLFLCSCNGGHGIVCSEPDDNGLCIAGPTGMLPSLDDVQDLLDIMDERLSYAYPDYDGMSEMLLYKPVSVEVTKERLYVYCEAVEGSKNLYTCDHEVDGATIDSDLIYMRYNACLGATALAHELLHSWEAYVLSTEVEGHDSGDHDNDVLFMPAGERCGPYDAALECQVMRAYYSGHKDQC